MPADDMHAVVFADADGVIRYWSPGAERLFGYAMADAIGRTLDLIVPDRYRERHWAGFRRAVQSGTAPSSGSRTNIPSRVATAKCGPSRARSSS